MRTFTKQWIATLLSVALIAPLAVCTISEVSAQRILQEHLKDNPSSSPETSTQNAPTPIGHEDLDATLWVRFAAEYKAITRQTYLAATSQLNLAMANRNWTAIVANGSTANNLTRPNRPVCVIMDVDETVLDNSAYQQELILSNRSFSGESWSRFVNSKVSPAVPGAKSFIDTCRQMRVTVFFVTNRDVNLEAATRENLISEGLMSPSDPDLILSKNECPEWTSAKSVRRDSIAANYRVLLLIGDDLNDFLFVKNIDLQQRSQLAERYQHYWGRRWFMLPNPDYGSWEMAVTKGSKNSTAAEKTRLKMKTLGGLTNQTTDWTSR